MKKYWGIIFIMVCLFGLSAFAQSTEAVTNAVEAPPEWLTKLLQQAYDLPMVGPYIVKGLQWFGVFETIITAFTGAILISLRALMKVTSLAGLVTLADKLELFKNSKVIYWLKYFSALNAPKTPAKPEETKAS